MQTGQSTSIDRRRSRGSDPEKVSDAVLDDNVDIHLIRKHFTAYAWLLDEGTFQSLHYHTKQRIKLCIAWPILKYGIHSIFQFYVFSA